MALATSRWKISGFRAIIVPVAKKVAGTFSAASRSNSSGVHLRSGPSSKVSEMVRWVVSE